MGVQPKYQILLVERQIDRDQAGPTMDSEQEMIYSPDIFYDINKLSLKKKEALLREAKGMSIRWWVDALDCTKSMLRKTVEMPFDEAMKKISHALCVFIHRRGYDNWQWYLETGFRTMTSPDYFLWINVNQTEIEGLVKKYKIKVLE